MSASVQLDAAAAPAARSRRLRLIRNLDLVGGLVTLATVIGAALWAFPLYWALVTTFKPEYEVVRPGVELWPEHFTFQNYLHVLLETHIGYWYLNSLITSGAVTVLVVLMAAGAGYAISQLNFPGRRLFWWMILASFMVPIQALIVNHFILMNQFHLINTLAGVVLPQLIAPVTVIIYKQFFDSVPKDFREAAVMDGANRLPAAVSHLSTDELGRHDRAGDHNLHRRLEPVPLAFPRRQQRGQVERRRRHHPGA